MNECKGKVNGRDCLNKGAAVCDNGFCFNHQQQASMSIASDLNKLDTEVRYLKDELQDMPPLEKQRLDTLHQKVQHLQNDQDMKRLLCSKSGECQSKLNDLMVSMDEVVNPAGESMQPDSEDLNWSAKFSRSRRRV